MKARASSETTATPVKAAVAPRWYGGDTHVHSINSWDVWYHPPTELATAAKALGFDFLFLTDHDSIAGRHEMHTNSTATFLAMQGEEVSLELRRRQRSFQRLLHQPLRAGHRGRGGPARPGAGPRAASRCPTIAATTPNPRTLTAWRSSTARSVKSDTVNAWDWYLKQGFKLMGRGSTDNHGDCGKITTLVWLERLCYSELYNAFKYGRACAVTGPGIECMLKVNGAMIGDTLGRAGRPAVECRDHGAVRREHHHGGAGKTWHHRLVRHPECDDHDEHLPGHLGRDQHLLPAPRPGRRRQTGAGRRRLYPVPASPGVEHPGFGRERRVHQPRGRCARAHGRQHQLPDLDAPGLPHCGRENQWRQHRRVFDNQSTNFDWTWANITQSGDIAAQFAPRLTPNGIPFTWLSEHGITNRAGLGRAGRPRPRRLQQPGRNIPPIPTRAARPPPSRPCRSGSVAGGPELFVDVTSPMRLYYLLSQTNLVSSAGWETNLCTREPAAILSMP